MNFANKLKDWRNRLKDRHMFTIVVTTLSLLLIMGLYIYKLQATNKQNLENEYNHFLHKHKMYLNLLKLS